MQFFTSIPNNSSPNKREILTSNPDLPISSTSRMKNKSIEDNHTIQSTGSNPNITPKATDSEGICKVHPRFHAERCTEASESRTKNGNFSRHLSTHWRLMTKYFGQTKQTIPRHTLFSPQQNSALCKGRQEKNWNAYT